MRRILLLLVVSLGVFAISFSMSGNVFSKFGQSAGVSDSSGVDSADASSADSSEASDASDSSDSSDSVESSELTQATDTADSTASSAPDTITTESGLKYIITRKGVGPKAKVGQIVSMHYAGRLAETGQEFDNSFKRNAPIDFPLGRGRVIKGWDEGIVGMAVGEARTLIIPGHLGYMKRGNPRAKIPPDATLIFDLELVAIK